MRGELADSLAAPAAAFAAVTYLSISQGGYFPTTWGPMIVVCASILIVWLAVGARTDATWRDASLIAALALLAGWTAVSTAWSKAPANSVLEGQRALVVLVGVAAILVLATRGCELYLACAVLAAVTMVAGVGLVGRLTPGRRETFDLSEGYRLTGPIGYWNGLGAFAAMGIVLAFGVAMIKGSRARRLAASVSLVVLAPTLYFTFSRGSVVALAVGIAVVLLVSPRRLPTVGSLILLVPAPAAAVVVASRLEGLNNQSTTLALAVRDGKTLIVLLIGLGTLAVACLLLLEAIEGRLSPSRTTRTVLGVLVATAAFAVAIGGLAAAGGVGAVKQRATEQFDQPPESSEQNLNDHFLNFSGSGRVDLWRVAVSAYRGSPVTGVGAGAFERYWQRDERGTFKARDAHSLYLETLTELGPFGLALILLAVGIMIASAIAARHHPIVPAGIGAFAVYAVHAGVEWDWELTGVTLAAFLVGSTAIIALRPSTMVRLRWPVRLGLGVVVGAIALAATVGYAGNRLLEQGRDALKQRNPQLALEKADVARRWAPWSPFPNTVRGEALLLLGQRREAHGAFKNAITVDPGYWRAWLGLAVASSGSERDRSLEQASLLYHNSKEIYETAVLLQKESE